MSHKFITPTGDDAFRDSYEFAHPFDDYGWAGVIDRQKRRRYLDVDGNVVMETAHELTSFDKDGFGHVAGVKPSGVFVHGILTVKDQWLLEYKYSSLGSFSDGLFCATYRKKQFCLDRSGKLAFNVDPFRYYDSTDAFHDHRLLVARDRKCFFLDTAGKIVLGPFADASMFRDGLAGIQLHADSAHEFIDVDGNVILTAKKFDHTALFWSGGLLIVLFKEHFGLLNRSARFVAEPVYDRIEPLGPDHYLVEKGDARQVLDNKGRVTMKVAPGIECLRDASEGLVTYEKNSRCGYLKLEGGDLVTEAIYGSAGPMRYSRAPVST